MKNLRDFLKESKEKGVTFTFGRFNPPTVGHAKLVDKLKKASGDNFTPMIFTSHSQDAKKNPLDYKQKITYLRKFFKGVGVVDTPARQVFEILTMLQNQNFTAIRMVVGSDRVKEFDRLIRQYNGSKGRHGYYNFKSIEIISAGERDPDADDVSGMSASKMRAAAEAGDFASFEKGVPSRTLAKQLYNDVRRGMGIMEDTLPDYMIEDLITEGVYDPGTFKAVFLMGGPGSGKSQVVKQLNLKALGLKVVNSDVAFERGLKKAGLSLDLRTLDANVRDTIRGKAKKTMAKGLDGYIQGRLGLIFDTTSAKAGKILDYKKLLDNLGYEYKMVYVNTSLEFAQQRNAERARKLPPEVVISDHEKVQQNVNMFKRVFGKDFIEIKNDDTFEALQKKAASLYSGMMSWVSKFPGNKLATQWREMELLAKKYK